MPGKGLKYTDEIARLRNEGLSDAKIAERLSISKSIITRNLHHARTQQRLAKLLEAAGLHALKQVLVSCEVAWRWTEHERIKLLEGKSTLTAENIGTLMRSQDKALEMAKSFLGKAFSPESLAKAERESDTFRQASENLKAIEARRVSVKE